MENTGAVYLSRDRLVELEKELLDLKTNQRKSIAERIAEARSQGDLSENAEYDAAKEEQGNLELKIAKLENVLSRVVIVNAEDIPDDETRILSKVMVKDKSLREKITYTLVSPEEADFDNDKISVTSPVGKALLNKKVGDIVIVEVPAGKIEYEILEISKSI
ncbi:MAG TPA: transcription elongation factor GreA [Bacteroidetes bacterium]|nr:transcription elongation factor GreA [Ignavibacteria bacterium]HCA42405.1 transcription elongation factor GreA [Bacteroidota bacterium]HCN37788.1 transcription elongation factor GreA [Bacteroidota bacterium]